MKEFVAKVVERNRASQGGLMAILDGIQRKFGYLPEEALRAAAEKTGRSLVDIYGVATFYKSFRLRPRGRHVVSVCVGTTCHVRGAPLIVEEFERRLAAPAGGTSPDNEFTLETVNCLGACALGPIVVADGHYFSKVKVSTVPTIIDKARAGLDKIDVKTDKRIFPLQVFCPHCNRSLMDGASLVDGQPSIKITSAFGRKHGWLRLSSLYGSYTVLSEYEIPTSAVADFFCPHCKADLKSGADCPECEAPMVAMTVQGGAVVQVCSRRGCRSHMLDVGCAAPASPRGAPAPGHKRGRN